MSWCKKREEHYTSNTSKVRNETEDVEGFMSDIKRKGKRREGRIAGEKVSGIKVLSLFFVGVTCLCSVSPEKGGNRERKLMLRRITNPKKEEIYIEKTSSPSKVFVQDVEDSKKEIITNIPSQTF